MKKQIFTLVLLGLLCSIGNVWGDNTPADAGTYSVVGKKPGGENKFYKLGDGVYIHRKNNSSWDNSLGMKIPSTNNNGVAVYLDSSMKLSILVNKKEDKNAVNVTFKVYPITNGSSTFTALEAGTDNSTTVAITIGETASYTISTSFAALDNKKAENKTTDETVIAAGYYYIVGTDDKGTTYLTSITLASAVAVDPVFSLTDASITTEETSQIQVGTKGNLDGISLSSLTYDSDVITVSSSTGAITPVAVGSTTITFNSGAVAGKYNASTGNALSITVTAPKTPTTLSFGAITSFDVDSDEDFEEPTLTISPNVSAISENITYSISNSGSNASINSSTGVVSLGSKTGTATVTATFDGDEDYREAEASYTINITEAPLRTIRISDENLTPTSSWDSQNSISGGSSTISCTANFVWEYSAAKFKNNSITIATEDNTKRLKKVEIYFNTADKQHPTASSQLTLTSGGGSLSMNDANTIASWEDNSLTKTVKSITINYTNNGNSAYINDVKVTYWDTAGDEAEVLISSVGWATLTCSCPLDFSGVSTLHAYLVTGHSGTAISKKEMTGTVPANTPLLLNGTTAIIPVAVSSSTDVSANKLQAGTGAAVSAEANKTKYVLGAVNDVATFLKINATPATVPVGKAYLEFDEEIASAPSALRLVDEENNATNIENINDNNQAVKFIENGQLLIRKDGVVYDTMGRVIR